MGESTPAKAIAVSELWLSKQRVRELLSCGNRKIEDLARNGTLVKKIIPRGTDGRSFDEPLYSQSSVMAYMNGQHQTCRNRLGEPQHLFPVLGEVIDKQLPPPASEEPEKVDLAAIPRYAYLTVREAAQLVRMPVSWIEDSIHSGRLAFEETRRGRVRVKRADIEDLPAMGRMKK